MRVIWILAGGGLLVLLVAAVHKKDEQVCKSVAIHIIADGDNFFVDQKDILQTIRSVAGSNPVGQACGNLNLQQIEVALRKNVWIKNAELYFDNLQVLRVKVTERVPVARVFSTTGATFYLDTAALRLPLSEKFSARVPLFTGFPSDRAVLATADSNLLSQVVSISTALVRDSFLFALIDQIDITPDRRFEMMPRLGNSIIQFGDAADAELKFQKLKLFYRQVMPKAGWRYYSTINLQYKGQVVARRRGAEEVTADSLRVAQLMQDIARRAAEEQSADSILRFLPDGPTNTTDSTMIQESLQRDEAPGTAVSESLNRTPVPATASLAPTPVQPPASDRTTPTRPPVQSPTRSTAAPPPVRRTVQRATPPPGRPPANPKPRVVMPPKNDY
jgi:cell division protein FtsQ